MIQEQETEEVNVDSKGKLKPVAFWQLHKNPILLRYIRSRLRWNSLAAALVITIVITVFTFAITMTEWWIIRGCHQCHRWLKY